MPASRIQPSTSSAAARYSRDRKTRVSPPASSEWRASESQRCMMRAAAGTAPIVARIPRMQIVIGNKNYSSWSMRPWVLAKEAGIPFEEVQLKFSEADGGLTVKGIERYGVAGKVPVLVIDNAPVWDSLAICETLAERFPEKQLWPAERTARQVARSICAEMHSGFEAMRSAMPMNIARSYPGKGMNEKSRRDIDRIVAIWNTCREKFGKGGAM